MPADTPETFQAATGCTDAVRMRLEAYAALLEKWQSRINLIGPGTVADLWRRHFLDSAQLISLLPSGTRALVDLGSGAGFPGAVLAVLGVPEVTLIESDTRKAVFLREVSRETQTPFRVLNRRIEAIEAFPVDVVTSRALAPVSQLLEFSAPFIGKTGVCLFLKGKNVQEELTDSAKKWNMQIERIPSITDSTGIVLKLERVSRHHGPGQSER